MRRVRHAGDTPTCGATRNGSIVTAAGRCCSIVISRRLRCRLYHRCFIAAVLLACSRSTSVLVAVGRASFAVTICVHDIVLDVCTAILFINYVHPDVSSRDVLDAAGAELRCAPSLSAAADVAPGFTAPVPRSARRVVDVRAQVASEHYFTTVLARCASGRPGDDECVCIDACRTSRLVLRAISVF